MTQCGPWRRTSVGGPVARRGLIAGMAALSTLFSPIGFGFAPASAATASKPTYVVTPGCDTYDMAVDPVTNSVYLGCGEKLDVINGKTRKISTIPVDLETGPLGVDPKTDTVYATGWNPLTDRWVVATVDCRTRKVTHTVTSITRPGAVAVDPATDTIYVVGSSGIAVISGKTNRVTHTIKVGAYPATGITVDSLTDRIYASNQGEISGAGAGVAIINGRTDKVIGKITGSYEPGALTVDPNSDTIYVIDGGGENTVSALNGKTDSYAATINVGLLPVALGVDPSTDTVFVANSQGNSISAIDGKTKRVRNIRVEYPEGVGVNTTTETVYVGADDVAASSAAVAVFHG
jgi:DNA-binding beta-propeller fold protein YncE